MKLHLKPWGPWGPNPSLTRRRLEAQEDKLFAKNARLCAMQATAAATSRVTAAESSLPASSDELLRRAFDPEVRARGHAQWKAELREASRRQR